MGITFTGGMTFGGGMAFTAAGGGATSNFVTALNFNLSSFGDGVGTAVDSDGTSVYVQGTSSNPNGSFLAKLNGVGTLQWHKFISGGTVGSGIIIDNSNNIVTATRFDSVAVLRFDSNGNSIGNDTAPAIPTTLNSVTGTGSIGISRDKSGNNMLIGSLAGLATQNNKRRYRLTKLNSSYQLVWMKDIISPTSTDGSSGTLGTIRVGAGGISDAEVFDTASDGSIYLAASTDANNPSPNPTLAGRGFVIKMDSSGNSVWQRYYDTGANYVDIRFTSVKVDSSGNIITAGVFNCQGQARAASQDTVTGVVKWDPSGNILWQRLFKPPSTYGSAASLMTDSSDNIYLVTKFGNSANNAIIKLNSAGTILWQRSFKSNFNAYTAVATGELSLIGSSILISFTAGSSVADPYYSPMYLKYPQDGSLTGTYTLGSNTVTIAATSYTSFTPTMSAFSTSDFTISNGSGFTTANIAVTTNTLNQIVTTIS